MQVVWLKKIEFDIKSVSCDLVFL